jgi:hypothetical protein
VSDAPHGRQFFGVSAAAQAGSGSGGQRVLQKYSAVYQHNFPSQFAVERNAVSSSQQFI